MRAQAFISLGWTPILAVVADGTRRVLQVTGWEGGSGTVPSTGMYVGVSGYVVNIVDAVDIRGAEGSIGNGITREIYSVAINTNLGSDPFVDYVYFVTALSTQTLPTPVGNTNRYTIKNKHSANITIDTIGAELIEGSASIQIAPDEAVDIISDNSNWFII
jgi:hydroxylamine reductase (hybrid-cluster protein)